ncbi:MFS transporter [Actinomadura opuntiae]|uniref:MFS transporter n=1 Tax=Actinomadura sp. OS1-43 TaxID=604315 RepID=UPI00255AC449|nr:MFS transporter [Actinomadura sp. OS1-43]MDL4821829.1 MFS transporter [Actinomadura sp. OS1-43]
MAVAAGTQMMVVLDTAVLAIALPRMAADLHIPTGALPWVMNAYALPFAAFLLLGGRIADLVGPVATLRIGLAVFAAASAGAGLAPSLGVLLACRGLQGLGGAMLSPASLALLTRSTAAGTERERAIAVWGVTASVGASASALFGGLLTQTLGWRWVLLINVAIAPLLAAAGRGLPRDVSHEKRPEGLDLVGMSLLVIAFGGIDLAATATGGGSQPLRSILAGGVAAAALGGLVMAERRVRHPLLPLRLLRSPRVAYTNAAAVALLAGTAATTYYTTLYAQDVSGLAPLTTAVCMLPATVSSVLTARAVPRLVVAVGTRNCRTAGPVLVALAQLGLAAGEHSHVEFAALIPLLVVQAVGSSISVITLTSSATRSLPAHQAGLAGGLITVSGQSGASIGLATLTGLAAALTATVDGSTAAARSAAIVGQVTIALPLGAVLATAAALLARRIPPGEAGSPQAGAPAGDTGQ